MSGHELWSDGYVTQVPYTHGFYEHLSPLHIELCLTSMGYRSPAWREGFTYCELGCGHGVTSLVLACLYPQGQFYVTDFNPVHVEYLGYFVKSLGLTNLHYTDASFAEYSQLENEVMFDYISLHGVYSWISVENRRYIQDIIRKRLKIGGVVSISYNVLPGWLMSLPLREAMMRYQKTECGNHVLERLQKSIELMDKMQENHAIYFSYEPVRQRYDLMKRGNVSYIMHEYFNEDWHPLYSSEVIDEMARAKLNYICSADILNNIPSCTFVQAVHEHILSIHDVGTRELVRDLYLNTQFRKDIYIRGGQRLGAQEQENWLKKQHIVLMQKKENINFQPHHGMVQINLSKNIYEPIVDNLSYHEPVNVYDFYRNLGFIQETSTVVFGQTEQPFALSAFWESLFTLVGFGYVRFYDKTLENYSYVGRFNQLIIDQASFQAELFYLILPHIHSVISLSYLEFLFLRWELSGKLEPLLEYIIRMMKQYNFSLVDDEGKALTSPEEQLRLLESKYAAFAEGNRLMLEHFGALAAINHLDKLGGTPVHSRGFSALPENKASGRKRGRL